MANLQKLKVNATEVEFSPLVTGYLVDRIKQVSRWRSTSNKLFSYLFSTNKFRYEIPVVIQTAADAAQINTWNKDNTELKHYADLVSSPTVYKTVHIVNEGDPMQMMEGIWEGNYEGTILLEEV